MLHTLDLFSGIGGFSLGLERTGGFRTVAFCEIDAYCRRVLAKHWPEVPIYEDVRDLTAAKLTELGSIDVICGGFPCQDISVAGRGAGLAGERSGLWSEYARLVGDLRPQLVIVENVSALLSRGIGSVLGDLASLGYDAEWHCIPASAVGAPHRRDRVWIVAHTNGIELRHLPGRGGRARRPGEAIAADDGKEWSVADAGGQRPSSPKLKTILGTRWWNERRAATERGRWAAEPDVGRVAHGIPARVDRLKCLGNAVVPEIPEVIGNAILKWRAAA